MKNLNTTPYLARVIEKRQDFHFRGKIKIRGKKEDTQECKECHKIFPLIAFTTKSLRSDGAYYLKKICRECHVIVSREHRAILKKAPPKPDNCDKCHKNKKLEMDHAHGTLNFRGWLCTNCNTGMGALGDNLEGVLRTAIYLEKDKSKIIEILNDLE